MPYWSYYNNNREDADKMSKMILAVIIISLALALLFPNVFPNGPKKKNVPEKNVSDSIRVEESLEKN